MGQLRMDGDRRGVRFERHYPFSQEEVWAALTESDQLAGWLTRATLELREGGSVAFDFGDQGTCDGAVLIFDPPRVLEYEWHFPGEDQSVVRWELTAQAGGTLFVLDHRRLGAEQATGYGAGWHAYLDALDAHLRGAASDSDWDARFSELLPAYREAAAR